MFSWENSGISELKCIILFSVNRFSYCTSTGGVFIQLSLARLAMRAGLNMRSSSSSSSTDHMFPAPPRPTLVLDQTAELPSSPLPRWYLASSPSHPPSHPHSQYFFVIHLMSFRVNFVTFKVIDRLINCFLHGLFKDYFLS